MASPASKKETKVNMIAMKRGTQEPLCPLHKALPWLKKSKIPYIVVATKSDKLNKTDKMNNFNALVHHPYINGEGKELKIPVILFSSETKEGRNELISAITKFI